jgi:hypothetical protein
MSAVKAERVQKRITNGRILLFRRQSEAVMNDLLSHFSASRITAAVILSSAIICAAQLFLSFSRYGAWRKGEVTANPGNEPAGFIANRNGDETSSARHFAGKELAINPRARGHLLRGQPARLEAGCTASVGKLRIIGDVKIQTRKAVDFPLLILTSYRVGSSSLAVVGIHRDRSSLSSRNSLIAISHSIVNTEEISTQI